MFVKFSVLLSRVITYVGSAWHASERLHGGHAGLGVVSLLLGAGDQGAHGVGAAGVTDGSEREQDLRAGEKEV